MDSPYSKLAKPSLGNLAVPRWNYLLRRNLLQFALAGSLWLALSPHSHADWEIVPAHPVWWLSDSTGCVSTPYPPDGVILLHRDKPRPHCNFEALRALPEILAVKSGTCGGQPGDLYGLEVTVRHWTGRIDVYDSRDYGQGCVLTYKCKVGTGYNGQEVALTQPDESPPSSALRCLTWKPVSDPSPPPPPPPPPGGPVPDYYYIVLTDGTTYPCPGQEPTQSLHTAYPSAAHGSELCRLGTLDLKPAQRTQPIFAYVYNGNTGAAVPGAAVEIAAMVNENSGGHAHLAGRPKGDLIAIAPHTGTSGADGVLQGTTAADGEMLFQFKAPIVAGDHSITARCTDRDCGEATGVIHVGHKELQSLSIHNYSVYKLVGQTDTHPDNHYLTLTADSRVTVFAAMYQLRYPQRSVLHLNDASLERGGVFDLFPQSSPNWKSPHHEHCRGTVVDIRANGVDGALNITSRTDPMIREIRRLGAIVGADPVWEVPLDADNNELWNLRHFHTKLMGQEGIQCP